MERLRDALEPLAAEATAVLGRDAEPDSVRVPVRLGDLRRLAAALALLTALTSQENPRG